MALLFTVLLSVSAAILGYFLYDFGRQDFMRETEAAIDAEISMLSGIDAQQPEAIIAYVLQRSRHDAAVRFRYETEQGKKLAGTIDALPPNVQRLAEGILRFTLRSPDGEQLLAAKIHTFPDGSRMVVARDIKDLMASYERLKHLSLLMMGLMLMVVLVSFAISHFVVSRINRIAHTACLIMETGDLSQRISIDSQWDDLSSLSQVLNSFLAQIESLMTGIREVSNNIAHDLRTPLTGLRSDIESLKGTAVTEENLDDLLAEADRILSIFQSLLRIANLERGKRHQSFGPVNLGVVLHDVIELYEPLAEEKQMEIQTHIPPSLMVLGDADLLFQLFANLLDNAIKFSPSHATVRLEASSHPQQVSVVIADQGPGVAPAEKEKLFQHFYRGDASRTAPGHGLGLSLVKAIITQHRGQILLEDATPGLRVQVHLPPYQ
jgi:signal transduction histidine kinase